MTQSRFATTIRALALATLFAISPFASADSWTFPAARVEKVYTFGQTRIVLSTDGRVNRNSPDFNFQVFKKGVLQSQVHGVRFEHVFPSPDGKLFVGLSNSGIPGSAVVVFNDRGAITLLASHGIAEFDYCEKSVSVSRVWYDSDNPQVKFLTDTKIPGAAGITLRDCRGKTVDLADVVLKAYNNSYIAVHKLRKSLPPKPQ